jgi:tetratricopeptide (TPR) repeat protein
MKPQTLFRLTGATLVAALVFAFSPALSAQTAGTYAASGLAKLRQGDYEGSIADYSKALEMNPNLAGAYLGRAMDLSNLGNYDGAIADCNAALKLKPENPEGYFGRGNAEFLQGNFDACIADFTKATELNPGYRWALYQRGLAHAAQTNLQLACEDLDKVYDTKLTNDVLNDYSALYSNLFGLRMGHVPDARAAATAGWSSSWTRILASYLMQQTDEAKLTTFAATKGGADKTLQQGEAWYFVGLVKLQAGDKAGAKAAFQKSLDTSNEATVVHRLARVELERS